MHTMRSVQTMQMPLWRRSPSQRPSSGQRSGPSRANAKEVLLWAFMLCVSHRGRVNDLDKWARKAVLEPDRHSDTWQPDATETTSDKRYSILATYTPIFEAQEVRRDKCTGEDRPGHAGWRGDGHRWPRGVRLKEYIQSILVTRLERQCHRRYRRRYSDTVRVESWSPRRLLNKGG